MNRCMLENFIKLLLQEELNHNVEINTCSALILAIEEYMNDNVFRSIQGR